MKLALSIAIGFVLGACGDDGGAKHDAGPSIDGAPAIDAPLVPITLTVTNAGAALAGVTVYFQNADSTLVAEHMTDGSGDATEKLDAGGYVSALVPVPSVGLVAAGSFQQVQIVTFAGVQPGDHLTYDLPGQSTFQAVNVTAALVTGATTYHFFTTCPGATTGIAMTVGASAAQVTASLPTECTTADVSVWAQGAGNFLQIAYKAGVTIGATLDLTATTYASPLAIAMSFTNVPSGVGALFGNQTMVTTAGDLFTPLSLDQVVTAGSAVATLDQPNVTGARVLTITEPDFGGAANGVQSIYELGPIAPTYAIDVGANVLRLYNSQPTYNLQTDTETWTEAATGLASDFTLAELQISRSPNSWLWTIAAPHATPSIAFPVLPTDVFDYNAGATDQAATGDLDSFKVPGGYGAVRAHVFDVIDVSPALLGTSGIAVSQGREFQVPTLRSKHHRHAHRRP